MHFGPVRKDGPYLAYSVAKSCHKKIQNKFFFLNYAIMLSFLVSWFGSENYEDIYLRHQFSEYYAKPMGVGAGVDQAIFPHTISI